METSLSEEVKQDLLECKICLEVMTTPKVLNCLHTFCEGCIEGLQRKMSKENNISCPVCRNVTTLPSGGVKSLRANFLINTLQDALGKSAKVIKCEYCDEKCSYTCLDCSDKMCFTHSSSHCNTKFTRGHKVVSMDDVVAGKYAKEILASQVIDCEIHQGKCMEFYCLQCEKMLCVSCKILDHEGHQCTSLEKAGKTKMASLQTSISEMSDISQVLCQFKSEIDNAQTRLVKERGNISTKIDGIADKMCAEIRTQQIKLKNELEGHFNTQTKSYELEKEEVEMDIASIRSGIEFGNTILKHGRHIDALSYAQQMEQNVKGIVTNLRKGKHPTQQYMVYDMRHHQQIATNQKIAVSKESGITLNFQENYQITNPILGSRQDQRQHYYGFGGSADQLPFGNIQKEATVVQINI
ncbi:unnamed protein product [Owenia fusiformis]|uniref:TRIM56 n=1 Tax=Owenia fusiformis TaxID=6347 RepID=A0A8S4NPB7_OWEFU|nr:unnamed protein product [Owenia fusiformis]